MSNVSKTISLKAGYHIDEMYQGKIPCKLTLLNPHNKSIIGLENKSDLLYVIENEMNTFTFDIRSNQIYVFQYHVMKISLDLMNKTIKFAFEDVCDCGEPACVGLDFASCKMYTVLFFGEVIKNISYATKAVTTQSIDELKELSNKWFSEQDMALLYELYIDQVKNIINNTKIAPLPHNVKTDFKDKMHPVFYTLFNRYNKTIKTCFSIDMFGFLNIV